MPKTIRLVWSQLILLVIYDLVQLTVAEKYYQQSILTSSVNSSSATTQSMCVTECISSTACVAITTCVLDRFYCMLSYCANIKLHSVQNCVTIVFGDINIVEGMDTPVPNNEWISTDVCGASGACAANSAPIGLPSGVLSSAQYYSPSLCNFFGSCVNGENSLFTADNITSISNDFTLFHYVKVNYVSNNLSVLQLKIASFTPLNLVVVNLTKLVVQYATATGGSSSMSDFVSIVPINQWTSIALTYSASTKIVKVFVNSEQKWNKTVALTSTQGNFFLSISLGQNVFGATNATVYCVKQYNSVLDSADLVSIASSCIIGKISYVSTFNQSINDSRPPPDYTYNGKNYYIYITSSPMTMISADSYCKSKGQSLLKVDSSAELRFIQQNFYFPPAIRYWTNLYRIVSTGTYIWLTDNSTVSSSFFESLISNDNCCPSNEAGYCYSLSATSLIDEGCGVQNYLGYPLCTA